ncbi:MAG: VOC family protein [Leptospirales bacterium]|nr:VOC family protein [Leptospirales bacterium]
MKIQHPLFRNVPGLIWRRAAMLAGLAIVVLHCAAAGAARPDSVGPVTISVSNLERSIDFYTKVLDFRLLAKEQQSGATLDRLQGRSGVSRQVARLQLGTEIIELAAYQTPRGRPYPESRSNDRWFQHLAIVVRDMDQAYLRLQAAHVQAASAGGPQTLPLSNPAAAGIRAFYFRDPDNHYLEIIYFPAGKGDPRWQEPGPLFAGIDHTAIVVSDSERSAAFYTGVLGLNRAGGSENIGPEQERLNNVVGAHLRISTYRSPSGPGIEFLQYLEPRDGRPTPADLTPSDLASWQTIVQLEGDPEKIFGAIQAAGGKVLSAGLVQDSASPSNSELLVQDPDGHGLLLHIKRR